MGRTLIGGTAVATVAPTPTTPAAGSSSSSDPRKEGLPMFATWTMQDDNFRGVQCATYTTDGMQTNNPWAYSVYSSPSTYKGGVINDKFFGHNSDKPQWYRTNNQQSSNSNSYMIARTQENCHWPSAHSMNIGPTGQFASNIIESSNHRIRAHCYATTQVLPEGVRPRIFLGSNDLNIFRTHSPAANARYGIGGQSFDFNSAEMLAAFPDIANRRYNTNYGMSGYNEKTGYYVLFTKTSNGNVDMFKWKIGADYRLTDPKVSIKEAFLNATEFEYRQMDNARNCSTGEGYYRGAITVGDNGYCRWTRMQESNRIQTHLFHLDSSVASSFIHANTPDSTGETYGAEANEYSSYLSLTTSYGYDQGSDHIGMQYNSTWDNKWHMHFCQYYYYGCGLMAYVTSTADPRICYRLENTNSNYGCSPIAAGTTGFILSRSQNSDSANHYWHNFNMLGAVTTVEERAANEAAGLTSNRAGSIYTYTNVNLSAFYQTIPQTDQGGLVPSHGYHSTNYPALLNVNWWPTKDGIMQYPGDY
jgi:hypothetical protein